MKLRRILILSFFAWASSLEAQMNIDTAQIVTHLNSRFERVLNEIDSAARQGKIEAYAEENLKVLIPSDQVMSIPYGDSRLNKLLLDGDGELIKVESEEENKNLEMREVKTLDRKFKSAIVVYHQTSKEDGISLQYKALGMGKILDGLNYAEKKSQPRAAYYIDPSSLSKILDKSDFKFLQVAMQNCFKSESENNKNGYRLSKTFYGDLDFKYMLSLGFAISADMHQVFDSMQSNQLFPKTFIKYRSSTFHKDSFYYIFGEQTRSMLEREKDFQKINIKHKISALRFKDNKRIIGLGWQLEGELKYPKKNSIILFPMEETHFITQKEILKFVPEAEFWFDLVFE